MNKKGKITKGHIVGLLKKQNIESDLKANMRSKLLQRLKSDHLSSPPFDLRVLCSLISEFLEHNSFKYTLSVFIPECGDPDSLLSTLELAELFKLDSTNNLSMLEFLLSKHISNNPPSFKDSSSQTLETSSVSNLEEQLLKLDMKFASNPVNDSTLEEKILKVQRECEARMKIELEHSVKRIREIEIVNMKLEEANKYQEMLKRYKLESEKKFSFELETLKNKEKKINDLLRNKESEYENKAYAQRQEFLLNMEKNDKNLAETKRKLRTEEQEIESMKETWKQRIQEYDEKLTRLEKTEKDLQVQAKEEFLRFRMEFESKFEDEKRKMMIEKVELEGLRRGLDSERLRGGQDEIENFDFELQKLRTENRVLKEQNASQAQAVNQLRTELKLIAETQNHLISQIGIKENANKVLQTELETYKTLSTELRENLNKMKNSHENEKRKLIEEVEGFKGSHLVHDFLIDKKYNWSKIYQEENQIKQEFFDLIKPSVHLYPQNQSKAATSEVPLKQQPNVKTYVNEFEYDSSSSKD